MAAAVSLASQPVPSASAARANPSTGRLASHEVSYPEESLALKVLSAVPFIGPFVTLGCQLSLNNRIETIKSTLTVKPKSPNPLARAAESVLDMSEKKSPIDKAKYDKIANLVESKNHYNYAGIVRNLVFSAAVVTIVALSIFSGGAVPLAVGLLSLGLVLFNAGIIGLTALTVSENKDLIERLRRDTGAPLGRTVQ